MSSPFFLDNRLLSAIVAALFLVGGNAVAGQGPAATEPEAVAATRQQTAKIWSDAGRAHAALGRNQLALEAFTTALKLDPGNAAAHEALGLLYLSTQQPNLARPSLGSAVALDASRWAAWHALGTLADSAGNFETAVSHYRKALRQQPGSPMLLNKLGFAYYMIGEFAKAEESFRQAILNGPGYHKAIENLAMVQARTRNYEQAVATLSQTRPIHAAYNDVGYLAFRNGDRAESVRWFMRAIHDSPARDTTAARNLERVRRAMAAESDAAPGTRRMAADIEPVHDSRRKRVLVRTAE